ncbi:MAG: metallophosphoesterase, partial [Gluconacetobacter diazotrophicus]|nr:metallophosphoesterase [Gluconacetobacter diazotrophicus]
MTAPPRMFDRRQFLSLLARRIAPAALAAGAGGTAYAAWEAKRPQVTRLETTLRHLPAAFDGLTVAFLADTHHGPFVSLEYLAEVVAMTNALRPDIVALGG